MYTALFGYSATFVTELFKSIGAVLQNHNFFSNFFYIKCMKINYNYIFQ